MTRQNLALMDRDIGQMIGRPLQEAMLHGITNDMIFGGLVTGQSAMQGLQTEQATKNCILGTRRVLANGTVYKYGRCTLAFNNIRQGIKYYSNLLADGIDYVVLPQTRAIGDTTVIVTCALGCTENEFAEGHLIVHTGATVNHQFRDIVSNTACTAGGTTEITVNFPWTVALTVAHGVEVFPNEWSDLRHTDGVAHLTVAGMPAISVLVADNYFWTQTWGACWGNPYGTTGSASVDGERRLTFDTAGNIQPATDNRYGCADIDMQHAGHTINRSATGTGYGLFMLQCSR